MKPKLIQGKFFTFFFCNRAHDACMMRIFDFCVLLFEGGEMAAHVRHCRGSSEAFRSGI